MDVELVKTKPVNMPDIYLGACGRKLNEIQHGQSDYEQKKIIKQYAFLALRYVVFNQREIIEFNDLLNYQGFIATTMDILSSLTPLEFVRFFPIEKRYDGDKWEMKDYFSTIGEINKLPAGKPIGQENLPGLLFDYQNRDVRKFTVALMSVQSKILHLQGKPDFMEVWAAENSIPVYSKYSTPDGKEFMINSDTHKSMPVKRPVPAYLKVVH